MGVDHQAENWLHPLLEVSRHQFEGIVKENTVTICRCMGNRSRI